MRTFKQIRTDETVKWFTPENKTIDLHVLEYEDSGLYGLVESWDNIDENSVLFGIAYGSARIVNSNVIGIVGHGALIEDSNVILDKWWGHEHWEEKRIRFDHKCRPVPETTHIEGLHVKNCLIDGIDGPELKSGGWLRACDKFTDSPIAKELFDFREVYPVPDYQKKYRAWSWSRTLFDNTPYTVARLKSNTLNGLRLYISGNDFCEIEPYDKGRDMKVFNDDYMDLSW